jgi:hypothetical protein
MMVPDKRRSLPLLGNEHESISESHDIRLVNVNDIDELLSDDVIIHKLLDAHFKFS